MKHFFYVPFTGLGNFNGYRGDAWLKNRIKIFKQFVAPSLLAQTNKNFTLWISWRYEEKNNPQVKELKDWLNTTSLKSIFTYSGVCFYDDKYPDEEARQRLINSLHGSMGELINEIGEADYVAMTIQPSDDCYHSQMVEEVQTLLKDKNTNACGYSKGYIMNYQTKEVKKYNPLTNPPFVTIKFDRETFINPLKHLLYTSTKSDIMEI